MAKYHYICSQLILSRTSYFYKVMKDKIYSEITPLSESDCFMVFSRIKDEFNYPIHTHENIFELNFIENAKGAKRVVGDSIEEIDFLELTLITNSQLSHTWLNNRKEFKDIKEITIQFHSNLIDENLLNRNQFKSIKELFEKSKFGVTFPLKTIEQTKNQIISLSKESNGVYSVLSLIGLLYDLSLSSDIRTLSSQLFDENVIVQNTFNSRRINKAYNYILENFDKQIKLSEVAEIVNMSETAFCRFVKKSTGKNFVNIVNEIRISHATRMLVDTTHSIIEICYVCGFNNLSNFNRIFKSAKNCTPREFRENYKKTRIII